MTDIIDFGNLVFNRLIEFHGESEEDRLLFLYGVTSNSTWSVINSSKWVRIEASGLSKNFEDSELDKINLTWMTKLDQAAQSEALRITNEIGPNSSFPRDGETYEFWKNEGPWRDIKF